jgi:hypothetical protein
MHHDASDIKLVIFNTIALAFTLTSFQDWLKVLILLLTVGYTARKWWLMEFSKNKDKNDE